MSVQEIESPEAAFGDLIDEYSYQMPQRGQILEATVIDVDASEILLDVGLKRDAVVTRKDLIRLDGALLEKLTPGKRTLVYVLQPFSHSGQLVVSINKALELEDWQRAQDVLERQETVSAVCIGSNRGGLLARFGRLQGFIPNSHLYSKGHIAGETLQVKVIEIERQRNRLVLSQRAAVFAEKRERMKQMKVGDEMAGKVVHLTDFGAFVDLNGADGLVHISNIAHQRIKHPSEALEIGQEIEVRIIGIDIERERISLNRKVMLPDPWQTFTARCQVGDLIDGRVTNVVDYGIFVATPTGMEGLVHISKMRRLEMSHPRDQFQAGDEALVRVLDIDHRRRRIQLDIDSVTPADRLAWMREQGHDVTDLLEEAADE